MITLREVIKAVKEENLDEETVKDASIDGLLIGVENLKTDVNKFDTTIKDAEELDSGIYEQLVKLNDFAKQILEYITPSLDDLEAKRERGSVKDEQSPLEKPAKSPSMIGSALSSFFGKDGGFGTIFDTFLGAGAWASVQGIFSKLPLILGFLVSPLAGVLLGAGTIAGLIWMIKKGVEGPTQEEIVQESIERYRQALTDPSKIESGEAKKLGIAAQDAIRILALSPEDAELAEEYQGILDTHHAELPESEEVASAREKTISQIAATGGPTTEAGKNTSNRKIAKIKDENREIFNKSFDNLQMYWGDLPLDEIISELKMFPLIKSATNTPLTEEESQAIDRQLTTFARLLKAGVNDTSALIPERPRKSLEIDDPNVSVGPPAVPETGIIEKGLNNILNFFWRSSASGQYDGALGMKSPTVIVNAPDNSQVIASSQGNGASNASPVPVGDVFNVYRA